MRIRVLGGGWYGCYITDALLQDGHDVELHEISDRLFSGASGSIPARLHCGSHYPRSRLTRKACKKHYKQFMSVYGHLTRHVPVNLYCIAAYDSLLDFGTYRQILREDIEFITVVDIAEFGLRNVEGAILTGERHIIVDKARDFFLERLSGHVRLNTPSEIYDNSDSFDCTIDCTFCARDEINIDRFELCLTVLLSGPSDKAVTIMDGGFPSIYPWDEENGISSLTSAKWTPIGRYLTWADAKSRQKDLSLQEVEAISDQMIDQMAFFYPFVEDYKVVDHRIAIRAMPRSGCDARLVDVVRIDDKTLRVRAGKIDAIFHAYDLVRGLLQ